MTQSNIDTPSETVSLGSSLNRSQIAAIVVASLGYFVDIYDLILFSIVRIPSLKDLGLTEAQILDQGILLLNLQMFGMLIGGVIFGVLGDRKGRLKVLFGSILLYSVANLLNAVVTTIEAYAALRFVAGVGLAGELGAGITLVAELLPKEKRGYGTTIIATIGVSGALLAWYIADQFTWRMAYTIGGVMGLALLLLRVGVLESGLFKKCHSESVERGNFLMIFSNKSRLKKFLACIAVGVPIWYVIGILVTLSPEFAVALGAIEPVIAGRAVFYCYAGLVVGDLLSGVLSQYLKSRRKAVLIFLIAAGLGVTIYFSLRGLTAPQFYMLSFFLGLATGYWAMFVTISAEQFGTNLRATVATSTPNFVRGSLVLVSALFTLFKGPMGIVPAGALVGALCLLFSLWGHRHITETFGVDLDYSEH